MSKRLRLFLADCPEAVAALTSSSACVRDRRYLQPRQCGPTGHGGLWQRSMAFIMRLISPFIVRFRQGVTVLVYEHQRTEEIVNRLRKADAITRQISRAVFAFLVADLTSQIGHDLANNPAAVPAAAIAWSWMGWVLGLIAGFAIIGPLMAQYTMYMLSPVLEWMCQLLIAQGAIAESLRQRDL